MEGKTFAPMAITLMLALASAFVLSLTFVPAMVALLVRGRIAEQEGAGGALDQAPLRALAAPNRAPGPCPSSARAWRSSALAAGVFATLGQEFIPQLDEKNIALAAVRIPSTSLEQSQIMQRQVERAVSALPEVAMVFSKTGTAEVATDPMPPNASDGFVILKPQSQWPAGVRTKDQVLERIEARLRPLLGNSLRGQPADPAALQRADRRRARRPGDQALRRRPGQASRRRRSRSPTPSRPSPAPPTCSAEQTTGAPTLDLQFDRAAIARYGLSVEDVADTVAAALGGREAGLVFEGDRRFDVVVRVPAAVRTDLDALAALPVLLPGEAPTPRSPCARWSASASRTG